MLKASALLSFFCALLGVHGLAFGAAPNIPACDGNGCGEYVETVPSFALKDAIGVNHTSASLYKDSGMLLMITVPNLTQYERQKRWEKLLKNENWPTLNAPRCVVLEDLSQQEGYKEKARHLMQEKSREESRETFLIDETGDVRRQFGVQQNETVILLVDTHGNVVHHEFDDIETETDAARRINRIAHQLSHAVSATLTAMKETATNSREK
jgi:hypothetical protein